MDKKRVKSNDKKVTMKVLADMITGLGEQARYIKGSEIVVKQAEDQSQEPLGCYKTLELEYKDLVADCKKLKEENEVLHKELNQLPPHLAEPANSVSAPPPIYKVITNGKEFRVELSKNDGETWMPEQELVQVYRNRSEVKAVTRRSYRSAVKYIKKQYGEKAIILPKEWRAV